MNRSRSVSLIKPAFNNLLLNSILHVVVQTLLCTRFINEYMYSCTVDEFLVSNISYPIIIVAIECFDKVLQKYYTDRNTEIVHDGNISPTILICSMILHLGKSRINGLNFYWTLINTWTHLFSAASSGKNIFFKSIIANEEQTPKRHQL